MSICKTKQLYIEIDGEEVNDVLSFLYSSKDHICITVPAELNHLDYIRDNIYCFKVWYGDDIITIGDYEFNVDWIEFKKNDIATRIYNFSKPQKDKTF